MKHACQCLQQWIFLKPYNEWSSMEVSTRNHPTPRLPFYDKGTNLSKSITPCQLNIPRFCFYYLLADLLLAYSLLRQLALTWTLDVFYV